MFLSRMMARLGVMGSMIRSITGLKQGRLIPLILILLIIAIVLGILSSSSFLAPFVYPLF